MKRYLFSASILNYHAEICSDVLENPFPPGLRGAVNDIAKVRAFFVIATRAPANKDIADLALETGTQAKPNVKARK